MPADGWDQHEVTRAAGTEVHAAALGLRVPRPSSCGVHGLGCSHRYFLPSTRTLAHGQHQVVAPDQPGFGTLDRPAERVRASLALADWLTAAGQAGAEFVANSAGCQFVVALATYAPELLGPVVLCPIAAAATRRLLADVGRERLSLVPSSPGAARPGI